MADNKKPKKIIQTSPRGVFVGYPKLAQADTKFKAEGEYSVKLALPADHPWATKTIAAITKMADEKLAEMVKNDDRPAGKKKAEPWKLNDSLPYANELDKDSGEETGRVVFSFKATASGVYKSGPRKGEKWNRKIALFDAKGQPAAGVNPWGGSEGCVSFEMIPYAVSAKIGAGVKLGLEAAQIIKLVQGGERDAAGYGFAAQEDGDGFDAAAAADAEAGDTTGDAPAGGDAGSDDDF